MDLELCQDPRGSTRLDGDRVFEMGRETSVLGHRGPAILQNTHPAPADIDHGFNRQHHPHLQPRSLSRLPIVGHLRVLMQLTADPMPHKSITTENPAASACRWMACEISESRLPTT